VAFNRSDLGRLMFQRIQTVRVSDSDLQWCRDEHHPHRHR
jgi:hypothetical protein